MTPRQGSLPRRRWTRGRRGALVLAAAVAAAFLLRLLAQVPEARTSSDTFQYLLLGRSLAAGEGYVSGGSEHPDLSRPPLLPLLVAAALPLAGGDMERAGRLAVAATGALLLLPLFYLSRGLFGARAGLAALLLGGASCAMGAAVVILPTAPFVLLILSAAACAWAGARRRSARLLAVAGALAGAAALARAEGLAWALLLAAWAGLDRLGRPLPRPGRLARAALVLAGAAALYAPYAAWASARLGHPSLAPTVEYLSVMRDLTDRLGLRDVPGPPLPWQERAKALPTADHRALVLTEVFVHGRPADPDPEQVALEEASVAPGEAHDPWLVLMRRIHIVRGNVTRLYSVAKWHHFLTPLPLVLAGIGLAHGLSRRRLRRGVLFVLLLAAGGLAPLLSHVEGRFLHAPHALGLILAAGGWGWLDRQLAGRWGRAGGLLRAGVGLLVAAALLHAGWRHVQGLRADPAIRAAQEVAAAAAGAAPPGSLLGTQPDLAFLAGRPFRLLPVGPAATVHDHALAQGAALLALEGERDAQLRPHLPELAAGVAPPGFRLIHAQPDPRGGWLRLYQVEPRPGIPTGEPPAGGLLTPPAAQAPAEPAP